MEISEDRMHRNEELVRKKTFPDEKGISNRTWTPWKVRETPLAQWWDTVKHPYVSETPLTPRRVRETPLAQWWDTVKHP